MSPTVNYAELTLEQKVQISNSPLVQRLAYIGRDDLVQQINGARTIGELTSMLQNIRAMNLDKESSRIVVNAAIGRARVILTAEHAVIVTLALLCAQGKKEEGNIDEARAVVKDVVAFSEFEQTVKSMSPNESNLSELNEVSKNNTELAAVIYDLDAKYNIGLDSATKAKLASIINEGGGTGVSNAMVFETSDVSQLNVLNRIMQAFRSLTEDVMKMLSDNRTEQNKLDQKAAENKSEETRIEKKQYEKKYLKKIADDRRELSKLESKLGQMIYATPEEADKVKNQIIANINKPRPIV
jgi:cell division protein FtsB